MTQHSVRTSSHGSTLTSVTCRARSVCAADPAALFVGARSPPTLTVPRRPPTGVRPCASLIGDTSAMAVTPPSCTLVRPQGAGPVGARLPRAAEPQRAGQEGRRRAERPAADREHLLPRAASPRSTRPTCAAGCAGGGSTPSASPGIDGGKTAILEPQELDDEYFMLRVRIDGGQLTTEQLRADRRRSPTSTAATPPTSPTGRTSSCTGSGSRTSRRSGDALEAVGLSTTEACGDTPRVDPRLPARRHRRRRDHRRHAGGRRDPSTATSATPEFSNLPRKFKTAISGCPAQDVVHEINDVAFVGVVHPEHGPGFDLWVGGGLSTNPMFAQRLGVLGAARRGAPRSGPA